MTNMVLIKNFNSNNSLNGAFKLGINKFSDLDFDEFQSLFTGFNPYLNSSLDKSKELDVSESEIWLMPKYVGTLILIENNTLAIIQVQAMKICLATS